MLDFKFLFLSVVHLSGSYSYLNNLIILKKKSRDILGLRPIKYYLICVLAYDYFHYFPSAKIEYIHQMHHIVDL